MKAKSMKLINIKLNQIKTYSLNAKKHPKKQIIKLKDSISRFGFRNPVLLDKNNVIIAGHGRIQAAKELDMKEVPCLYVEDLTETEIKALRLMDNRSAESEWDEELLKLEFKDLKLSGFELELTGFDLNEIESMEKKTDKKPESVNTDVDRLGKLVIECPNCKFKFNKKDMK